MIANDQATAQAAKCLHMAKRSDNTDHKQSWLALAESWFATMQLLAGSDGELPVTEEEKAAALAWAAA